MWDLPGPGIKPVSPSLASEFLTTEPPGKSLNYSLILVLGLYPTEKWQIYNRKNLNELWLFQTVTNIHVENHSVVDHIHLHVSWLSLSVTVILVDLHRKESSLFMKSIQALQWNKGACTPHEFFCCDVILSRVLGKHFCCLIILLLASPLLLYNNIAEIMLLASWFLKLSVEFRVIH